LSDLGRFIGDVCNTGLKHVFYLLNFKQLKVLNLNEEIALERDEKRNKEKGKRKIKTQLQQ